VQKDFKTVISRREFGLRAAVASAAVSISPMDALALATPAAISSETIPSAQQTSNTGDLPAASQAEPDARLQSILGQFGSRFSDEQKADLKRLCSVTQNQLDRLRAFSLENGDGPALYLKPLVEREKKAATPAHAETSPAAPANAAGVAKSSD
jgi:hypothetical protein